MLQDAENDHSHWKEWNKAEAVVLRLLATSRLPAAEQEIGKLWARGLARTLGDESEAVEAPGPGAEALPELSDLRAFALEHEGLVQARLSAVEREACSPLKSTWNVVPLPTLRQPMTSLKQ